MAKTRPTYEELLSENIALKKMLAQVEKENAAGAIQNQQDDIIPKTQESVTHGSNEQFKAFFERSPFGSMILDDQLRYVAVNQSAATINGLPIGDHLNKPFGEVFPKVFIALDKYKKKVMEAHANPIIIKRSDVNCKGKKVDWSASVFALPGQGVDDKAIGAIVVDETKQNLAQYQLKDQNLRYSTLLKNIKGLVYRCKNDKDWTMDYVSEGCMELTGYHPQDLINNNLISFNDLILPKHQKRLWNMWQDKLAKGEQVETEYEIYTASGEIRWVWERGRGIFDNKGNLINLQGIITDINDRKLAQQRAEKLSKAVDQSPESIVITDLMGTIEYVNPVFTQLTGYTTEEAIGQNPRVLQSGEHKVEFYQDLWETILSGKVWYGEILNHKKNGEPYWERASISPIFDEEGEITHFVAVKEDITKDKKLMADLKKAKEKAEESDRLKSAFLANMSHEIRTPMNGILGFADLLREPGLTGTEQEKYVRIIEKSGERMLNIINDLIDISKIEAGQMELIIAQENINHQIDYLYVFFKPEAEAKNIHFSHKKGLDDELANIITDKEKLYAVLTNLLKNAIKYTEQGSIEYGYQVKGSEIEFYVKDTGRGIPVSRQKAIFERFVQADMQIAKPYEGAGLGLAITKAYVEMLGGSIRVESNSGEGSCFYVNIPYHTKTKNTIKAKTISNPDLPSGSISDLNILIAEDDDTAYFYLEEIFSGNCKSLHRARNGEEAVETYRQIENIDLVLMDIKMPVMDGYAATQKIRELDKDVPIIAQTAYALVGDRDRAMEAGCTDYISKPIKKENLLELIQKIQTNEKGK